MSAPVPGVDCTIAMAQVFGVSEPRLGESRHESARRGPGNSQQTNPVPHASTFDPIALAACASSLRSYEVLGCSFRTLVPAALPTPNPLPPERLATLDDVDRVGEANHPEVFDDPGDTAVWVGNGWVTLFELPGGLAGFGLCTPTGPKTPACDVGIRVCAPYQRRGLGAWIVQRMAARAKSQGLVPTAGCAIDNAVSRRTLERTGFVADHRLLQFELR